MIYYFNILLKQVSLVLNAFSRYGKIKPAQFRLHLAKSDQFARNVVYESRGVRNSKHKLATSQIFTIDLRSSPYMIRTK